MSRKPRRTCSTVQTDEYFINSRVDCKVTDRVGFSYVTIYVKIVSQFSKVFVRTSREQFPAKHEEQFNSIYS